MGRRFGAVDSQGDAREQHTPRFVPLYPAALPFDLDPGHHRLLCCPSRRTRHLLARRGCCPSPASARAGNALHVYVHEVEGHRWVGIVKESRGEGGCLAWVSPRLQVSSSAGKPSAGGGALPKKVQGQRRFVLSVVLPIYEMGMAITTVYGRCGLSHSVNWE
jgi:hypothetical protein